MSLLVFSVTETPKRHSVSDWWQCGVEKSKFNLVLNFFTYVMCNLFNNKLNWIAKLYWLW